MKSKLFGSVYERRFRTVGIIALGILSLLTPAIARADLHGRVVATDSTAVADALVTWLDAAGRPLGSCSTDSAGHYRAATGSLPVNALAIAAFGYRPDTVSVGPDRGPRDAVLSPMALGEVVVSGKSRPKLTQRATNT